MTIDVFNDNGTVLVQIKNAPSGTDKRIADALCDGVVKSLQEFLIPQPDDSAERLDSIKESIKNCETAKIKKQAAPVKEDETVEDETVEDETVEDEIPVGDEIDDGEFDEGAFAEKSTEDATAAEDEPAKDEIPVEDESAGDKDDDEDDDEDDDFFNDCFA